MKRNTNDIRLDITGFVEGFNKTVLSVLDHQVPQEEETKLRDIAVEIEAQYSETRVLLDFTVTATAHLVCDLTAEPFTQSISGEYSVLFTTDERLQESEESDEIRYYATSDKSLNLTDLVIDTLLLAIPLKRISPNAPQETLNLSFGAPDSNAQEPAIDPRWEALKKLK